MSNPGYRTIKTVSSTELIIKKSKFICQAAPVASEADVQTHLQQIRKQYPDATHHCYAYVIGERGEIQKSNDDGEPGGTAGRPMLEVIHKEDIKNALVVVTRYFGGIQLGAGGLVRAYGQAAGLALHAAGIVACSLFRRIALTFDYTWHGTVERELQAAQVHVEAVNFTDQVRVQLLVPANQADTLLTRLMDVTRGQLAAEDLGTTYSSMSSQGE